MQDQVVSKAVTRHLARLAMGAVLAIAGVIGAARPASAQEYAGAVRLHGTRLHVTLPSESVCAFNEVTNELNQGTRLLNSPQVILDASGTSGRANFFFVKTYTPPDPPCDDRGSPVSLSSVHFSFVQLSVTGDTFTGEIGDNTSAISATISGTRSSDGTQVNVTLTYVQRFFDFDEIARDTLTGTFTLNVFPFIPNLSPTATAGLDQTVTVGDLVTLDGSGSFDPDNAPSPLTFSWTQTAGPAVTLIGATTATPTFTPTAVESYTFSLTVNDGRGNSAPDEVAVTASPAARMLDLMTDPNIVWANGHEIAELTVQVTDATGAEIPGRQIRLSANPPGGIVITPTDAQAVTGAGGKAFFKVRSTKTGDVAFTATDVSEPTLTDSEPLQFIQRQVVVFVQGINSSLKPDTAEGTFPTIRTQLGGLSRPSKGTEESGIQCTNVRDDDGDGVPNDGCPLILNYSYRGGEPDFDTGIWQPISYVKKDTARSLFTESIPRLKRLIRRVAQDNPNTRFVIIGHSQGGLIALHALELVPNQDITIDGVITLDGALGGAEKFETRVARFFTPWGNPAAAGMEYLWDTATNKSRLGTTALDNRQLVRFARSRGTAVMTLGNRDDCIWNPRRCGLRGTNNSSTQINEDADVHRLLSLGGNCGVLPTSVAARVVCLFDSHGWVLENPRALNLINDFVRALPTAR